MRRAGVRGARRGARSDASGRARVARARRRREAREDAGGCRCARDGGARLGGTLEDLWMSVRARRPREARRDVSRRSV